MPTARLLLGTANPGKVAELAAMLGRAGWQCVSLAEVENPPKVDETGSTLAENAALKATAYARHAGLWTLADDTGLMVDALGGAPGVHSARYAGPHASKTDNCRRLLNELADVPLERRTAHFACQLTLADPQGNIRATTEGQCHGRIRPDTAGTEGFGYDSLFEVVEYHRTFGQLPPAVKGVLSHRARALEKMLVELAQLRDEIASSAATAPGGTAAHG